MMIGSPLAGRDRHSGSLRFRRLLFQGHHHRGAYAAHIAATGPTPSGWVLAAFLTAFYSWRLLFMTFHGKPRMDEHTWRMCTSRRQES